MTTWERDWKLLTGWKRWLLVAGAIHASFTDLGLLADQIGIDTGAALPGARSLDITRAYVRAFFDQHLREQTTSLAGSAVTTLPRGHVLFPGDENLRIAVGHHGNVVSWSDQDPPGTPATGRPSLLGRPAVGCAVAARTRRLIGPRSRTSASASGVSRDSEISSGCSTRPDSAWSLTFPQSKRNRTPPGRSGRWRRKSTAASRPRSTSMPVSSRTSRRHASHGDPRPPP